MEPTRGMPGANKPLSVRERRLRTLRRSETISGFLFVSPMLIGVTVMVLIPIIATLLLGFADWNFVQGWDGIKWVGLDNFRTLWQDEMFRKSLLNNIVFADSARLHADFHGAGHPHRPLCVF